MTVLFLLKLSAYLFLINSAKILGIYLNKLKLDYSSIFIIVEALASLKQLKGILK
jgi:hypothetical protein